MAVNTSQISSFIINSKYDLFFAIPKFSKLISIYNCSILDMFERKLFANQYLENYFTIYTIGIITLFRYTRKLRINHPDVIIRAMLMFKMSKVRLKYVIPTTACVNLINDSSSLFRFFQSHCMNRYLSWY